MLLMRIVIISFDALEFDLVEKYQLHTLMQSEYGKVDLNKYLNNRPQGRGSGEPLTGEVYDVFLRGRVPEKRDGWGRGDSIFTFSEKSLAIDVPASGSNSWMDLLTGSRFFSKYFRNEVTIARAEEEYFKYAKIKSSYARLISIMAFDLIMFYFKFPDKLGHMYKTIIPHNENANADILTRRKRVYEVINEIAKEIIDVFDDGKTLIIIHSDHGFTEKFTHSHHGFWSSNIHLGMGQNIELTQWFDIIRKWHKLKVEDYVRMSQTVRKEELVKKLKAMGYF